MGRPPKNPPSGAVVETQPTTQNQPDENNPILDIMGCDDGGYKTNVYKFSDYTGNRRDIIWQLEGVPTIADIASRFGGGRYAINVLFPDSPVRRQATVTISDMYMDANGNRAKTYSAESMQRQQSDPFAQLSSAIDLLDKLSSIIERSRPPQQAIPEQITGLMSSMVQSTGRVMEEAVATQSRMALSFNKEIAAAKKEIAASMIDSAEYDDDDEPDENNGDDMIIAEQPPTQETLIASAAIEAIGPLVQRYLGDIIGEGPASGIVGMIKMTPTYRNLVKNPGALDMVKTWIRQEVGDESAEKVFSTIGV